MAPVHSPNSMAQCLDPKTYVAQLQFGLFVEALGRCVTYSWGPGRRYIISNWEPNQDIKGPSSRSAK